MSKYRRLRQRVVDELGPAHGLTLRVPEAVRDDQLERAHETSYIAKVVRGELEPREVRRIGFPWSPSLVERSRRSVGGTLAATRAALDDGLAVNLAGGTHHAFADHGEGFCVWNDAAVAARCRIADGSVRRVLIVDADVHQGNGTAAIFRHDPAVFTLSLHGRRNYPLRKERSDLDIELDDETGDEAYLDALEMALERAIPMSGADLVIYLAGADPFVGDKLGRLSLSKSGLAQRDALVFDRCHDEGMAVAVVMAGGYAPDVEDIVDIHLETVRSAASCL